jgi:hypothetical protein
VKIKGFAELNSISSEDLPKILLEEFIALDTLGVRRFDKRRIKLLKRTLRYVDGQLENKPDVIDLILFGEWKRVLKLEIHYSSVLNESEERFLDWVAETFENNTFRTLIEVIESHEKLMEEYLSEAFTQESEKRLVSALRVSEGFRDHVVRMQSKFEFYLPQASMRREKQS